MKSDIVKFQQMLFKKIYNDTPKYRLDVWQEIFLPLVSKHLRIDENINSYYLDMGCGLGYNVIEAAKKGVFAVGVEISPDALKKDEYAEYLGKLVNDERLAWKMGYEAWSVAKSYTWEGHTKKLASRLNEIV